VQQSNATNSADCAAGRSAWIGWFVLTIWMVLAGRLLQLQWVQQAEFASVAMRQQVSAEAIRARPGDILDRRGRLLATTIVVSSCWVDPSLLVERPEEIEAVAGCLGLDAAALRERIEQNRHKRFLWIKRRLDEEEAAAFRQLKLPRHLTGLRPEFQRYYPQGALAAHVLGLRDIDGVGRGGLEQAFDESLRGHDGRRRFVRDARGTVLDLLEEVTDPPVDGLPLATTLDCYIQYRLEQELDSIMQQAVPQGACGIVIDPRRGEVLAMASRPAFDPRAPHLASEAAWKNLCIAAAFEPGSTIKPLIVGRAIDHGLFQPGDQLYCERGAYRMGPRILRDHQPHGLLSISEVLSKSSNIGMAKVGEKLGNEELHRLLLEAGFGQRTGIELPGEVTGQVRPLRDWNLYSTGSIPMGQELTVTPLQMLTAHAAVANGGTRITPHLLQQEPAARTRTSQVVVSQLLTAATARWLVTEPLTAAVAEGTGTRARISGLQVFGKTGTAQKVDPVTGGYSQDRHVSSFVCGAPAADPQLLVLITVDEPQGAQFQFGGAVAAPPAAAILKSALEYLGRGPAAVTAARPVEEAPH
jgi:cell division protein FtsI/penicillin-binding protein 2